MKNHKLLYTKKGVTLIELIVAISLLAILSVTFSSIYTSSLKTYSIESIQSDLQTDSQTAIDRIANEVKGAQDVSETYETYTSSETTMILRVPAIDENQEILYIGDTIISDYTIYYLQSGALHRKIYADESSSRYPQNGRDYVIATGVEDLSFVYSPEPPHSTEATITMTLGRDIGKIHRTVTLTRKTKMRNT